MPGLTDSELIEKCFTDIPYQSREWFLKDYHHARDVMCSKTASFKEICDAFSNLSTSYTRCEVTEADKRLFVALIREWDIRRAIEIEHGFKR